MELSLHTLRDLMTSDFAIDMAVNVVGYLIAGTIGVMIYRLFRRDKGTAGQNTASVALEPTLAAAQPRAHQVTPSRVQFVRFGERKEASREAEPVMTVTEGGVSRRNRSEIIRVARSMIKAGATYESIRKVLPISEAELSLLSSNNS